MDKKCLDHHLHIVSGIYPHMELDGASIWRSTQPYLHVHPPSIRCSYGIVSPIRCRYHSMCNFSRQWIFGIRNVYTASGKIFPTASRPETVCGANCYLCRFATYWSLARQAMDRTWRHFTTKFRGRLRRFYLGLVLVIANT